MEMQLSYQMTDGTGKALNVWNERTHGVNVSRYVGPFETIDEARTYCGKFVEGYGLGYNPRAEAVEVDGKIYAYTTRWTSCD